ncbi:MAG: LPS export ABC transporter permease LptF [Pseudomonadota bacterium]|nr:LPS export ABC transporter permease LptF [Pseudomonadota bacterium]
MKIIDRYTLKQIIIGFVLVLLSMTTLVWLTQSLRMIDMIVTKGVSVGIFLELTVLVLPNFLQILSPLVLFAVALFTLIRMQADKELMVMQAVGMSPRDIMRPIFRLGGVLMILGYAFSVWVIPMANSELREMKWKVRNDLSHLLLQEGQFNTVGNGLTLYIKEKTQDGQAKGILFYDSSKKNKVSILSAASGIVFQEPDGIRVDFYDGSQQEFRPNSREFSILKFEKNTMTFPDTGKGDTRTPDVRELSLTELWRKTKQDVGGRAPLWRKHKVEFVKRLTQPIYNVTYLFLVIFGVLAGYYNRRGQMGRIYLTVGMAVMVQSMALAFENMAGKNLWFLILVVLNAFTPMLFVYGNTIGRNIQKRMRSLIKVGAFIGVLLGGFYANAAGTSIKLEPIDTNAPVDFEADKVSYNHKNNEMTARGNVVLKQDGLTLETEQILFQKNENRILAPDAIKITTRDGTVAHTRSGELAGDLSAMKMGATDVRFYEGTFLQAGGMERKPSGDTFLTQAVYTPCDVCEGKSPLWQITSQSVWNDVENHDLVFKHSFLEVKDVPVLYLPYWRMPDFTVKRRSGFLAPSLSSTHEMGRTITMPYFIDLADNQNLTLTPIIAFDHFPMGLIDYRGRFSAGVLNIAGSGTQDKDDHDNEGHIKADFEYDMTENWRLSGQLYKVATDTYFRRYRIPGVDDTEPFLSSDITAERFGNRNYFKFKTYSFQSLQDGVSSHSIPVLLPVMDFKYNTSPIDGVGMYGFTDVNMALFNTREHFKSNRLSLTQGVSMPYIGSWGGALDLTGYVRVDDYAVDTGDIAFADRPLNDRYNTGRIYPNISATLRYPFVKNEVNTTQIFEPIVMMVASSNGGNSDKIPNVDSLVFDFDDTDLFSANRFSGYDRVEPGQRINYGVKWSRFNHKTGRSISALIGQSYRLDDDPLMAGLMGYDSHFSNYVGRVQITVPYAMFFYRARLDQKTLSPQKNEVGVRLGNKPLQLGVNYVMRKAYQIGDNRYGAREEVVYSVSSQLTQNISASGYYRYDLSGKGEPVKAGGSVRYDNECSAVLLEIDRSYTEDRNYKGSLSVMLKLILKTLGGI